MIPVPEVHRVKQLPIHLLARHLTALGYSVETSLTYGGLKKHALLLNGRIRCALRVRYFTERAGEWDGVKYGGWKFWLPSSLSERIGQEDQFCECWLLVPIQQDHTIQTDKILVIPYGSVRVNCITVYATVSRRQRRSQYDRFRGAYYLLEQL